MCNRAAAVVKKERREAMKLQLQLEHMYEPALDLPTINPTDPMPVVVNEPNDTRSLVSAAWGKPDTGLSTMNARGDRLEKSPMWAPLVTTKRGRGVIVLSHGFEPLTALTVQQMGRETAIANVGEAAVKDAESGTTVWHGFKRRDGEPMLVAALVDVDDQQRRWATMVTTEAGPVFSRIHRAKHKGEEREIANLRSLNEVDAWLNGALDYQGLLRGAGDDFLESWRCPPGAMKKEADPGLKMQTWAPPVEKQRKLF
ncbi:MAG: SOS response-associated peptidase family protein [Thermoplasmatota archaeon]